MINFKDQLQKDLDNVFFNNNEFAETLIVNGIETIGIIDENYFKDAKFSTKKEINIMGDEVLQRSNIALLLKVAELGYKPNVGSILEVNSVNHRVQKTTEESGMYIIELSFLEES